MTDPRDRLPEPLIRALCEADERTLRAAIRYARERLDDEAAARAETVAEAGRDPPWGWEGTDEEWAAAIADCEAPARATPTVKTIDGNEYYYWQWSDGDATRSEYFGPKP